MADKADVITIDGPSGSGKGTIARVLARRLGWHLLDSGALYRAVALAALEADIALDQPATLAGLATSVDLRFEETGEVTHTLLNGRCVDAQLRAETTGEAASQIAQYPQVRAALLELQRGFARPPGLVADGRDMGTVIFPRARWKFFLTAAPQERAARRHKQLKEKGISVSLAALAREIAERDLRDSERSTAPLRPASDASLIDSTALDIQAVVALIVTKLEEAGLSVPSSA
ncbi:MAG TPA: (d)CMP kinase [Gammaproteobacteria bacterium]|nr:(d)CMP kinase [Gammaproteobacteria bacterium]